MDTKETHFGYSPEEYRVFRKYAWRYLIMFSLLYCFLYCTRLNLSNASAMMMDGMGWTASDIGILTSTLFWTYGIGQLINGRLAEIVGPTRFVFFAVILSVAANVAMGFSSSILVMAILWGLNGYFQSMGWTPGLATLTAWWPGNTRGFATGFAHAFSGFGQVAATLTVALAIAIGAGAAPENQWRFAFFVPAVFPVIMMILYKVIARPRPGDVGLEEYKEEDPEKARAEEEMRELMRTRGKLYPYKHVLRNWRFIIWLFIAFATGLARYGLVTWVPLYFIQTFDVDITAGLLQSLALPVGMGVGTLVVPWLTDRYCPDNRLPAVILSAVGAALSTFAFYFCSPGVVVELLLFIAGFCIYAINGTAWAFATDIGGRVFSGTAAGCLNCAAYVGAAVQSLVYGFVLNSGGWGLVFFSLAGFCGAIVVLGFIGRNRKEEA